MKSNSNVKQSLKHIINKIDWGLVMSLVAGVLFCKQIVFALQFAVSNSKFFTNFVTNFGDLSNSKILRKIFAKISTDFH